MFSHLTVRDVAPGDRDSVAGLALDNAMFGVDELDGVLDAFDASLDGSLLNHRWLVAAQADGAIAGAAYVAPEPFADRLWNLYFLAVRPDRHGAGVGTHLIARVEGDLVALGEAAARILVVETSSTLQYEQARSFYRARGFDEEARIREFYGPDDDKVVFWKRLVAAA